MLTGFQSVKGRRDDFAKKSNRLGRGQSPFQQNVTFTVTDWDLVQPEIDGKVDPKAVAYPVLVTTIGIAHISMLVREVVTADGKPLQPSGEVNEIVRKYIFDNKDKHDYDILQGLVDTLKDKKIVVSREFYLAKTSDGREYGKYLVNLNFAD